MLAQNGTNKGDSVVDVISQPPLLTLQNQPISALQHNAIQLWLLGLNVFPVPYRQKGGWAWSPLQYTRLDLHHVHILFRGYCNTAIMTGRTSGNLLVIDCETPSAFQYHKIRLQQAGIPIWAVRTGGKRGGGHFYLHCQEGEVKNIKAGEGQDYEIRGNRCYVLSPMSVHPDGGHYEWYQRDTQKPPTVSISQLDWLNLELVKTAKTPQFTPTQWSPLSAKSVDFLTSGAPVGERNNRLFAAACDLAGNDYSLSEAAQLLIPVALDSGLDEREIQSTINSAFSKSREPSKKNRYIATAPPPHQRAILWIEGQYWQGRTGMTDKFVLLAHCECAQTANPKGVFRASIREVAEKARVTPKTVRASVKRLIAAKFLFPCGYDQSSGASLFRLSSTITRRESRRDFRNYPTDCLTNGGGSVVITSKNDAMETKALGKTAYSLYQRMVSLEKPVGVEGLAELVKLTVGQVYRALRKLRHFRVAKKIRGKGYVAIPMDDEMLDEWVSKPAGTYGKGQQRCEQHRQERMKRAASILGRSQWGKKGYITALADMMKTRINVRWVCSECGQVWHGDFGDPPPTCDFCEEHVVWQSQVKVGLQPAIM